MLIIVPKMAEKLRSASSSSNKRMKKMEIDRVSALPDCLLISILSLLDTREAMRTCVLSRRWLFLWTDLPALAFRETSYDNEKNSKFVARVHNYLIICGRNHLRRFEVSFCYNKRFASNLNAWVQFALKHKVEDLALLLDGRGHTYMLPQMMYSNSYLTCLSLQGCIMAPKNTIEWGALSSLYLEGVEFRRNAIKMILSGCPLLHELYLKYCSGLNCLNVKSQSLRKLTLIDCDDDDDDDECFLEISAPFIHYAKISVLLPGRKLRFSNMSSLVEADVDFELYEPDAVPEFIDHAKEIFQNLHHVKKLKVGPKFMQALSKMVEYKQVQLLQSGLECLKLNVTVDKCSGAGIVCLLESSPSLKTLHISLLYRFPEDDLKKHGFRRNLLSLKTVTIEVKSSLDAELTLTLVQLLLKRAPALEKMVIEFILHWSEYCPDDYIRIAQRLLSYPRTSTKAAVVLAPVKFPR